MLSVTINPERCKGCELCVSVCPQKIIAFSSQVNVQGYHPATVTDPSKCTGCGFCFYICPDVAITVVGERRGTRG